MKVEALVGGIRICVQIVQRGDTRYIRRCADWDNPSPAQYQARKNLALAAIDAYDYEDKSRERVNQSVKANTRKITSSSVSLNEIERLLLSEYPEQVIQILGVED